MNKKLLIAVFGFVLLTVAVSGSVRAVGFEGTETYVVADTAAVDGDILISTQNGLVRTDITGDSRIFGILQEKPIVVYRSGDTTAKPVMRSGVAQVNVSNKGGAIKVGDYITAGADKGKGQKAAANGYVIGTAMDNYDSGTVGQIPVAVRIEYAEVTTARSLSRLFEIVGSSFLKDTKDPQQFTQYMKYFSGGLVLLIAFFFAFVTFSRSVPKAIEAIGRNPLARNFIYLSLAINIALVIGIVAMGILAALVIVKI